MCASMRIRTEKELRKLKLKGKVTQLDGERLKLVVPKKDKKVSFTSEERQANALERLVGEISGIIEKNDRNSLVLLEMIRKINIPVKPVLKWKHTISRRDGDEKAKEITSEAIIGGVD